MHYSDSTVSTVGQSVVCGICPPVVGGQQLRRYSLLGNIGGEGIQDT